MDEEYNDSVDTSADMDVSDVDVSDVDVSDDIPADVPDDIPEDDYSDTDVAVDFSEDVSEETAVDDVEYDEADESIEEDSMESESDELDESINDIEEDTLEESEDTSEDYEELDDISEDTDVSDEELETEVNEIEDIPEDTGNTEMADQDEVFEEDIPEDVTDTEATDETTDVEDSDAVEQPEDMTDAEATNETTDIEDADTSEQPEDMTDTEAADETTDVEDADAVDQTEYMTNTEATDETTDADGTYTTEQPENVTDTETTDETTGVEDTDATEQPEDVIDTEATGEATDAAEQPQDMTDTDEDGTIEQSENTGDLEIYDYETSPETQDVVNPESSGEFVSAENPYREKWEQFGEEFSDEGQDSDGWDSLKDIPFSGETQSDTVAETDDTELTDVTPLSKQPDIEKPSDATEINSIFDYMNAHNYGPDNFATYSQDPQWRQLMRQEYPDYELPEMTQESANAQLFQYMNDHNYGMDDYAEYSQDPIWRELHSTAFPNDELPSLSGETGNQNIEYSSAIDDDGGDMNPSGNSSDGGQNPPHTLDDVAEGEMFGSFETDKHINGSDSFIKGDNYEQFKKDYYSPEESTYEEYDIPKVKNAGDDKELGSFADRIRNFFTHSKDADSVEPGADDIISPNQDIQAKWTPPAIEGADVKEPAADITPLDATRQSINTIDLSDGSKAKVFDHPNNLRNILPFSQGKNEYSKNGTCALADTGTWLKVAGSKHVENDVVGFASTHSDRQGQPLCSKSGGTLPSNIPDIWEHFGMPAYSDSSKNLESIAEAVESGRAVSVGVNAGILWEQDNAEGIRIPQNCYGDGGANHAIGVMSCERDPVSGNITHFYVNDTGRTYERDACRRISIGNFWKAFNVKRACATISQKPVW